MRLENQEIETLHQLAQCLWAGDLKISRKVNRAYRRHVAMLVEVTRQSGGAFRKAGDEQ